MSFLFCAKALRMNGFRALLGERSGRRCLRPARRCSYETFGETKLVALVLITISCVFATACGHLPRAAEHGTTTHRTAEHAININTATLDELQRLPHVGEKVAARIIEHREVNGPFRRVEHLMLIQGISDKRFRKIRSLVRVE